MYPICIGCKFRIVLHYLYENIEKTLKGSFFSPYMDGQTVIIDLLRVGMGATVLFWTAYLDLKTRIAENRYWLWLGIAGIVFFLLDAYIRGYPFWAYLGLPMASILFFYAVDDHLPDLINQEGRPNPVTFSVFFSGGVIFVMGLYLARFNIEEEKDIFPLIVLFSPIYVLFGYILYYMRILHGGADAKAFITLSLLHPIYPSLGIRTVHPILQFIPFSFVVVVFSAVIAVFSYIPLLISNYFANKKESRSAPLGVRLFGRLVPLERLKKNFYFIMEDINENGQKSYSIFPSKSEFESHKKRLVDAGYKRIWAQRTIPFLVPMAFGYVLAVLLQSPFLF